MLPTRMTRRPAWGMMPMSKRLRAIMDDPFFGQLEEPLADGVPQTLGWLPAVDAAETADEYTFKVELPGMKREDITVTFEKDVLTIKGEKTREEKGKEGDVKFHLFERTYGEFLRTFTFPATILPEKIEAVMADGVLTVKVPKAPEAKPAVRKIEVKPK